MASTKFTKETIKVYAENIKYFADEIVTSIANDDDITALSNADRYSEKISDILDDIAFRLKDCEDY